LLGTSQNRALLPYHKTPVTEVFHPLLARCEVRLLIRREDLNHPFISGNKWWKLKYNLQEAVRREQRTVLTYGGAFSNHIYATAAAARELHLRSIGIIRGEQTMPLNRTLQFATECGMELHYLPRAAYREMNSPSHARWLEQTFGEYYRIPEGGTNDYAVKGCEEFGNMIDEIKCDFVCLPVGTGGTMAGMVKGISPTKKILGFAVLKNAGYLNQHIRNLSGTANDNWTLLTQYAYGGYAKRHPVVSSFIKSFFEQANIPLDFVYTGKMMCALFDLIEKRYFKKGTTILAIHTGGLQGHS
jgi:1-aminocyclopropane-1-carboxylate deaminase